MRKLTIPVSVGSRAKDFKVVLKNFNCSETSTSITNEEMNKMGKEFYTFLITNCANGFYEGLKKELITREVDKRINILEDNKQRLHRETNDLLEKYRSRVSELTILKEIIASLESMK